MAENRVTKRLKYCDTEEKAALKSSWAKDEEEEAGPDSEEDSGVGLSVTCEGSSSSNFDVFISHRGPDTGHTLAYHMYDLLQAKGIRAFLDKEELQIGEGVSEAIKEAIRRSKVQVCILSGGYAQSDWCLKELEMMICKYEMGESKLIPVFYDVEPWEVRHLKGAFGQGFQKLVDKNRYSRETVDKWRRSLYKTAGISGVKGKGERCRTIVDMICKLLFDVGSVATSRKVCGIQAQLCSVKDDIMKLPKNDGSVATSRKVCGIQAQLCSVKDDIMKLRKNGVAVTFMEISGIRGIGKTIFAREFYNMIRHQYQRSCFIQDVNGLVEKHGVNEVHRQLISELLGIDFDPSYCQMKGKELLSNRLNNTEFLVVLDNIHCKLPVSYVFIEDDVFRSKESLIIVTSRERGILTQDRRVSRYCQNFISLQMKKQSFSISKQIFCEYAFGGIDNVKNEFNELINYFVKKCHGVPLALVSLANVVGGKDIKFWRNLWNFLKDSLFQDANLILKLSYDNLQIELEKHSFFDVATFLRREKEELLLQIQRWIKRKLLFHKTLNVLNMHDLLVDDLGKSIIKDDPLCLGCRSRLSHPRDVKDVLSEEMVSKEITRGGQVGEHMPSPSSSQKRKRKRSLLSDQQEGSNEQKASSSFLPSISSPVSYPLFSSSYTPLSHHSLTHTPVVTSNWQEQEATEATEVEVKLCKRLEKLSLEFDHEKD